MKNTSPRFFHPCSDLTSVHKHFTISSGANILRKFASNFVYDFKLRLFAPVFPNEESLRRKLHSKSSGEKNTCKMLAQQITSLKNRSCSLLYRNNFCRQHCCAKSFPFKKVFRRTVFFQNSITRHYKT